MSALVLDAGALISIDRDDRAVLSRIKAAKGRKTSRYAPTPWRSHKPGAMTGDGRPIRQRHFTTSWWNQFLLKTGAGNGTRPWWSVADHGDRAG
jgi:hypothetical protein